MVRYQIEERGITDKGVLEAMRKVERHRFVPLSIQHLAYEDTPLPIGEGDKEHAYHGAGGPCPWDSFAWLYFVKVVIDKP